MDEGERRSLSSKARSWALVAVAGAALLGAVGITANSGDFTASNATVTTVGGAAAAAIVATPTPAVTPTAPNGASTIDEFGPTCDRVADRILQTNNGEIPYPDRTEVVDCLVNRLEGRKNGVAFPLPDDLNTYSGGIVSPDQKRVVIVSEGPLPSSALLRLGPIPSGFTVQQRTNGLRASRVAAIEAKLTQQLNDAFDGGIAVTVYVATGGRSAEIGVTDSRLPCTGYSSDPVPSDDVVARVEAAARKYAPDLEISVQGYPACLRFTGS